jgi:hypothetical protein
LVEGLQVQSYASKQCRLATTAEDRAHQQHEFVDRAVAEGTVLVLEKAVERNVRGVDQPARECVRLRGNPVDHSPGG